LKNNRISEENLLGSKYISIPLFFWNSFACSFEENIPVDFLDIFWTSPKGGVNL